MSHKKSLQDWQKLEELTARVVDALNHPIDPKILDLVVALRAHGLPTSGSCEGHLNHGHPYPWVEIYPQEPTEEGWEEKDDLRSVVIKEDHSYREKVLKFLEAFYASRPTPAHLQLCLVQIAYGFRIQCADHRDVESLSDEEKKLALMRHQEEMAELAAFLKKDFLQN